MEWISYEDERYSIRAIGNGIVIAWSGDRGSYACDGHSINMCTPEINVTVSVNYTTKFFK